MLEKDDNVVLLDVRTVHEFQSETGHLRGAILIPLQELPVRVDELNGAREKTIIAYCRTGNRSGKAAAWLHQRGFRVLNMEGGIVHWNEESFPVVKEPRT